MLGRTSFTFVETAGDLAHGIHFFFVLDRKREEIDALPGLFRCCGGHKYRRIAIVHKSRTVGLRCHTADVYRQFTAGEVHFISLKLTHSFLLLDALASTFFLL